MSHNRERIFDYTRGVINYSPIYAPIKRMDQSINDPVCTYTRYSPGKSRSHRMISFTYHKRIPREDRSAATLPRDATF